MRRALDDIFSPRPEPPISAGKITETGAVVGGAEYTAPPSIVGQVAPGQPVVTLKVGRQVVPVALGGFYTP